MRRPHLTLHTAQSAEQAGPVLLKNYLGPCILLLLGEQRAHGYDLLARLPEIGLTRPKRDGRYADSGFVYRTLRNFEKEGLVRSTQEGTSGAAHRRIYELTQKGRDELGRMVITLSETGERVEAFLSLYQSSPPRAVLRRPLERLTSLRRRSDPGASGRYRADRHSVQGDVRKSGPSV